MKAGSGFVNHSAAVPAMHRSDSVAIHGLRRPARSAMAPSTGLTIAIASAETLVAQPQ